MKIAVSACLTGCNCKYNGGNNLDPELTEMLKPHQILTVCPEVLGGLPTPRVPAEIVQGTVMNAEGTDVDREFRRGAELALKRIREFGAELVILQSRSPSCGIGVIYDGTFSGNKIPGNGVFAEMLIRSGIPVLDVSDRMEIRRKLNIQ